MCQGVFQVLEIHINEFSPLPSKRSLSLCTLYLVNMKYDNSCMLESNRCYGENREE